jgi:hypothetical protein
MNPVKLVQRRVQVKNQVTASGTEVRQNEIQEVTTLQHFLPHVVSAALCSQANVICVPSRLGKESSPHFSSSEEQIYTNELAITILRHSLPIPLLNGFPKDYMHKLNLILCQLHFVAVARQIMHPFFQSSSCLISRK